MFEVSPATPLYFPEVQGITFEPFWPKVAALEQIWSCEDTLEFQLFWPAGIPAGVEAIINGSSFFPVSHDGIITRWSISLSAFCGETITVAINWTAAESPWHSAEMLVTDDDDCLKKTILITYANETDGFLNSPYKATLATTVRLRAYYQFNRVAPAINGIKPYSGLNKNISAEGDRIYEITIPPLQGTAWVHSLISTIMYFDTIQIKRHKVAGYRTDEPESMVFIAEETGYTANFEDPLGPNNALFPGTGFLKLRTDKTILTLC